MKPKIQKIKINGLRQRVFTWGSPKKPVLILLHGWLDTGASFHFMAQDLLDRFYCVAPDMRGYGKSEHTSNPLGYFFFEYIADLYQLINIFTPRRKVSLLGHSLGGAVVSTYAGTYPEKVSHLINVEGFGFQGLDVLTTGKRARLWLDNLKGKRFRTFKDEEGLIKRLMKNYPRFSSERTRFLARNLGKKVKGGFQMAADPKHKFIEPYPMPVEVFYSLWKNTQAKSLFILGGKTEMAKYFPKGKFKEEFRKRSKHFPKDCKIASIEEAGHMVPHERPEDLAKLVSNFII